MSLESEQNKSTGEIVVVAGGDPPDPALIGLLDRRALVLAADSGADHALGLGLTVTELIGDLDSVTAEALQTVEAAGARVDRYPVAKDFTDLELTLARAVALGARHITVVGGNGGRPDHALTGLMLLADDSLADVAVCAWHGQALVSVLRPGPAVTLIAQPGTLLSLVAIAGVATGVTTTGLRYPLDNESLSPTRARGVSNEATNDRPKVALETGVLLAIQPDALASMLALRTPNRFDPPPTDQRTEVPK